MIYLKILRRFVPVLSACSLSCFIIACAEQPTVSLFPIKHYDQTIDRWIKPSDPNFDKPLLNTAMQKKRMDIFYDHYFGLSSPWNAKYIDLIIHRSQVPSLKATEEDLIKKFSNKNKPNSKIGYGENFRPHTDKWIENIAKNLNIDQFAHLHYQKNNRGIAVTNLAVRALPTNDVHFYNYQTAGQGYPFDNLQVSSLWAGTPIYIVGSTQDHTWYLIISPALIGWVKSDGIAKTSDTFINTWTITAKNKLAAITRTQTSLLDGEKRFLLTAYVGSVFPVDVAASQVGVGIKLLIPAADSHHNAIIKKVLVSKKNAAIMPLTITPHHFADIMRTLIGRPYGWGGIYFYNDCSAELKSLFTPFGIWLPRHSSEQLTAGKMVDMSLASPSQRLSYLMTKGKPFLTITYIGGHVFLYIGNDIVPQTHSLTAMTYQNLWGLKPNPPVKRVVIGQAVLFPLLLQYPENPELTSLVARKYFKVSYLNELPVSAKRLIQEDTVDVRSLMYPESSDIAEHLFN
ncbi:MAG: SH3 domain-containing protein [Pseudomonadota bacterium]